MSASEVNQQKMNWLQRRKKDLIDVTFPGQVPALHLRHHNYRAYKLAEELTERYEDNADIYYPQPISKASGAPDSENYEAEKAFKKKLAKRFSRQEDKDAIHEFREEIQSDDTLTESEKLIKKQQLFLMMELGLVVPPNEAIVKALFDVQLDVNARTEKMRELVLSYQKERAIESSQLPNSSVVVNNFKIEGQSGLDAIVIHPKQDAQEQPFSPRPPVIVAHYGNMDCYENHLEDLRKLAEKTECTVVGFNVRGMGLSQGQIQSSTQEAVDDAKSVLSHLTTKGFTNTDNPVDLNAIMLKGESIGAAVLTVAADQFSEEMATRKKQIQGVSPEKRDEPYVYNSRSFSNLGYAAAGFVTRNKTLGNILGRVASNLLDLMQANLKPAKAYDRLRDDRKDYMVIKKDKDNPNTKSDDVIATFASLHKDKRVQAKRRKEKDAVRDNPDELQAIKSQHKVTVESAGHSLSVNRLKQKNNETVTGETLFNAFAEKARAEQEGKTAAPNTAKGQKWMDGIKPKESQEEASPPQKWVKGKKP